MRTGYKRFLLIFVVLLLLLTVEQVSIDDAPRIVTDDGNLLFQTAQKKSIRFQTQGEGQIRLNDIDLNALSAEIRSIRNSIDQVRQLNKCNCDSINSQLANNNREIESLKTSLTNKDLQISTLSENIRNIQGKLTVDECANNPCHNGGQCIDGYNSFKCICPNNYQGRHCTEDVDECPRISGTIHGCQNNARCENTFGGFRCVCVGKWSGVLCNMPVNSCANSSNVELCGHGTCIPDHSMGNPKPFKCICEPGWALDPITKTCISDIDECRVGKYPCSTNPLVQCINTPGDVTCAACPTGFEGNGYYCRDINECANSQACGINEQCINSFGSFQCQCIEGMRRNINGLCQRENICEINNGGCSSLATCTRNNFAVEGRICSCMTGFVGNGVGINGCTPDPQRNTTNRSYRRCVRGQLCRNGGTCVPTTNSFKCRCLPGFSGRRCRHVLTNPCLQNPCLNEGRCEYLQPSNYRCHCKVFFTGTNCEIEHTECGGTYIISREEQEIGLFLTPYSQNSPRSYQFPCTWTIVASPEQFIQIKPITLQLRGVCSEEYVQLSERSHLEETTTNLGRYCQESNSSAQNYNTSGSILIIKSKLRTRITQDHGFKLKVIPTNIFIEDINCCQCVNSVFLKTHLPNGAFQSPHFPIKYSPDINCVMEFERVFGERYKIELNIKTMDLGDIISNCSDTDYLQIVFAEKGEIKINACNQQNYFNKVFLTSGFKIHFFSDNRNDINLARFQIRWKKSTIQDPCGGIIALNPVGAILGPSISSENEAYCTWKVEHTNSSKLVMFKGYFENWISGDCSVTFEIMNINSQNGNKSVFHTCQTSTMINELREQIDGDLVVIFKKTKGVTTPSFRLTVEYVCGLSVDMDQVSVYEFQSDNYPLNYDANLFCTYKFTAKTRKISIKFKDFDINDDYPCNFDYIELTKSSLPYKKFCNGNKEELIPFNAHPIESNIVFNFKTNSSVFGQGFRATATVYDCGGSYLLRGKLMIGYPETYLNYSLNNINHQYDINKNCTWEIQSSPGTIIFVIFDHFHLENHPNCMYDYLKLSYDNQTKVFCGNNAENIYTTSNKLNMQFFSDYSVPGEGFLARIYSSSGDKQCHETIEANYGFIYSPPIGTIGRPYMCYYFIKATPGRKLLFNITMSEPDSIDPYSNFGRPCFAQAKLKIINGAVGSSTIKEICPQSPSQDVIVTSHNIATIVYLVPQYWSATEFNFTIFFSSLDEECGSVLNDDTGEIASPNYPLYAPVYSYCRWEIRSNPGKRIKIIITHIRSGSVDQTSTCDTKHPVIKLKSNSKEVDITCLDHLSQNYYFDDSPVTIIFNNLGNTKYRFRLTYMKECLFPTDALYGRIESSNDIGNFLSSCIWKLNSLRGNSLSLQIDMFDLPPPINGTCQAYVQITDSKNTIMRKTCGSELLNRTFISFNLPVSIEHRVSPRIPKRVLKAHKGFILEYQTQGCIKNIYFDPNDDQMKTTKSGSIESYQYPNSVSGIDCMWNFQTEMGYSVRLKFNVIDLDTFVNCTEGPILKAWENEMTLQNVVFEVCQSINDGNPVEFQSSSHNLFLKFFSANDSNGGQRKIQGTYEFINSSCEYVMRSSSGIIKSPNYPNLYPFNLRCQWLLNVRESMSVHLRFLDFETEDSQCRYDHVDLLSPVEDTMMTLKTLCGSPANVSDTVYESISNKMLVKFRSDHSIAHRGFKATYFEGCGGIRMASEKAQFLLSPNYPHTYNLQDGICEWNIVANTSQIGLKIFFYFLGFEGMSNNQNCSVDNYLTIIDGIGESTSVKANLCSSQPYHPIISSGHYLKVVLRSHSGQAIFKSSYGTGSTACGGDFYLDDGILTSPFYPNAVNMEIDCVYIIRNSPGSEIDLIIEDFSRQSENAYLLHDFLEIRIGSTDSSPKLGRFYTLFDLRNATNGLKFTNSVYLRLRSQGGNYTNDIRFMARYHINYPTNIRSDEGTLASPQFGHVYNKDTRIIWNIDTETSNKMKVSFDQFSVGRKLINGECSRGKLMIVDSMNNVKIYCGSIVPEEETFFAPITVTLTAEGYRYPGFLLHWYIAQNESYTKIGNCEYIIRATNYSQSLTSPNYPEFDPENRNCQWTILTEPTNSLEIKMLNFSLENSVNCKYENFTAAFFGKRELNRFYNFERKLCGTPHLSAFNFFDDYYFEKVKLTFKVDEYDWFPGFQLSYKKRCYQEIVISTEGWLGNKEYPNAMTEIKNCTYILKVIGWRNIVLNFTALNLPPATNGICENGKLNIFNDQINKTFCGSTLPSILTPLLTNSTMIAIRLTGNFQRNSPYTGFQLRYGLEQLDNCGGNHYISRATDYLILKNPLGNMGNTPSWMECQWYITSPYGTKLQINFEDLIINGNCTESYLAFYDGSTPFARKISEKNFCLKQNSIFTTRNALVVVFKIAFENIAQFQLKIQTCSCGGLLYRSEGFISSPNYPLNYPAKTECLWQIVSDTISKIKISFLDLRLSENCSKSNLSIFSVEESENKLVWSYCNNSDWSLNVVNDKINVFFSTNTATTNKGFQLKYKINKIECGGVYSDPSKELESINYPRPMPAYSNCVWMIETDISRRIVIKIKKLTSTVGCFQLAFSESFQKVLKSPIMPHRIYCEQNLENYEIDTNLSAVDVILSSHGEASVSFSYHTNQPALCGGHIYPSLNDSGIISFANVSVLACYYIIHNYPENEGTVAVRIISFNGINCGSQDLYIQSLVYEEPGNYIMDYQTPCANRLRESFVSMGKEIGLSFRIQRFRNRSNYEVIMAYKYNRCGGLLTAPFGIIMSPGYPNKYPNYADCEWVIKAPQDMFIQLSIQTLHLESHQTCSYDHLYIRFGGKYDSPPFKKYCGLKPVDNETSVFHHNLMRLSFHSDFSVRKDGFLIEYSFVDSRDSCTGILYNNEGSIKSPNYPRPYPSHLRCNWTVIVSQGYQVNVSFEHPFDLETVHDNNCPYDSLKVYDSDASTLIANLCGHNPPPPIISSSNRISLVFSTDFNLNLDGFHAKYYPICGQVLNNSRGEFSSPTDFHSNSNSLKCSYIIPQWKNSLTVIELFTNFIRCVYYDSLIEVYLEDRFGNYVFSRKICGPSSKRITILHTKSIKLLYHMTRNSITYSRFKLTYLHDENVKVINNLTTPYLIKTPLFPSPYHHNADLLWKFNAPEGYIYYIELMTLDVEPSEDCRYDYVAFYNDSSTNLINRVQIFCGTLQKIYPFKVNSNLLTVHFYSDASHFQNHSGILAYIRPTPGPLLGCGGYINVSTETGGIISHVDRDNNGMYDDNLHCDWLLLAPFGYALKITFENSSVSMEKRVKNICRYDYLTIYDGSTSASPIIQTMCNGDQVDPIISHTNEVLIVFKTDFSIVDRGFKLHYTTVASQNYIIRAATNSSQILKSPNYPDSFPWDSRFMAKLFSMNETDHIIVEITDLQIRPSVNCSLDQFIIQDVSLKYINKRRRFCKSLNFPFTFISSHDQLVIQYRIGPLENSVSVPNRRFQLTYKLYDCNRFEQAYSGNIKNVEQYKQNKYSHNSNCTLTLKAPEENLRFQFYFKYFNLERSTTCRYDYLQFVFGKENEVRYTLPKICGDSIPASFISNSSQVSVIFVSDRSIHHEGYEITYVVNTDPFSKCGGDIELESGVITSPGFGNNYYENGQCIWNIALIPDTYLLFSFTDLQLGNSTINEGTCHSETDYVKITYDNQSQKFCGYTVPNRAFVLRSTGLKVEYKSLDGGIGSGFRILWNSVPNI